MKTWSFSFNLSNQTTRHEELGAILTAKKDNRGGHYASQNARYDWLTFNHFADMSEANFGVTLSNQDCSFFKLGQSSPDSLWEHSSQINALAGGQTDSLKNGGTLGVNAQYGQTQFQYNFVLTTHNQSFNPVSSMKFSMESQNPLVADWVNGEASSISSHHFSLLSITNPNVLLWTVKPSEEGIDKGLITRFWNIDSKAAIPTLNLSIPIKEAWQTTHIETNHQPLKVNKGTLKTNFNAFQMKTYRVVF